MVSATVDTVGVDPTTGSVIVLLRAQTGERLPMVIGALEAQNIILAVSGQTPPRPLLPDLMLAALRALGATLLRVEVTELRDGTFFARLVLEQGGEQHEVDARPSDAVSLALRAHAQILVDERVLFDAGVDAAEARLASGTKVPEA
jgi:bifunctional DNase/RNase